jgi:hypothetical protein
MGILGVAYVCNLFISPDLLEERATMNLRNIEPVKVYLRHFMSNKSKRWAEAMEGQRNGTQIRVKNKAAHRREEKTFAAEDYASPSRSIGHRGEPSAAADCRTLFISRLNIVIGQCGVSGQILHFVVFTFFF